MSNGTPEAALQAERHCTHVIVGDVEKDALDRAEGRFDVITFGDVLEHLVSPGTVLSRCRHLLSDRGFVLISVPNVAHYTVRLRLLRGRFRLSTAWAARPHPFTLLHFAHGKADAG